MAPHRLTTNRSIIGDIQIKGKNFSIEGHYHEHTPETVHTLLRAEGFSCPSCVGKIEKQVGTLDGVDNVTVHFASGRIEVDHDEAKTSAFWPAFLDRKAAFVNAVRKWRRSDWFVPVISGLLILVSLGVEHLFSGTANITVGPRWWVHAGEHAHGSGDVFTLANAFILAAAVVVSRVK